VVWVSIKEGGVNPHHSIHRCPLLQLDPGAEVRLSLPASRLQRSPAVTELRYHIGGLMRFFI